MKGVYNPVYARPLDLYLPHLVCPAGKRHGCFVAHMGLDWTVSDVQLKRTSGTDWSSSVHPHFRG